MKASGQPWNSTSWDWKPDESGMAFASSAERNKEPVTAAFRQHVFEKEAVRSVLEIGSGTGQHVQHFAQTFPSLTFYPTELSEQGRAAVTARCGALSNVEKPFGLDVLNFDVTKDDNLIGLQADAMICSNIFHVAPEGIVEGMARAADVFKCKYFAVYGAFKRHGKCTTEGNASFDAMLQKANPAWGLKDVEGQVAPTFANHGFELEEIVEMPANNFVLVFTRK